MKHYQSLTLCSNLISIYHLNLFLTAPQKLCNLIAELCYQPKYRSSPRRKSFLHQLSWDETLPQNFQPKIYQFSLLSVIHFSCVCILKVVVELISSSSWYFTFSLWSFYLTESWCFLAQLLIDHSCLWKGWRKSLTIVQQQQWKKKWHPSEQREIYWI